MQQSATKELRIVRGDTRYTTYEHIPSYVHPLLVPNAKCFTDVDENGMVIDQQILESEDWAIYYHFIHLAEGVHLDTVLPFDYALPAHVSGFTENNPDMPLRIRLRKKTVKTAQDGPEVPADEKEFILSFHVNFNRYSLKKMSALFPAFKIIDAIGLEETRKPSHNRPFQLNLVSYQVMQRICHCKYIGKVSDVFLERNALDFYLTYLHFLQNRPPIMLEKSYQQQLKEIATFILQHPLEAVSKEALCQRFKVVPEFLEAPFEQQFLATVEQLIEQEKMACLFKMIAETDYSLAHIAAISQYNSRDEMVQAFGKYYRCVVADLRMAQ